MLRFSKDTVLNIEFKSKAIAPERIKKQLIQNRHYLNALPFKNVAAYTYVVDDERTYVYTLNQNGSLIEGNINQIIKELNCPGKRLDNIEKLFDPSQYLVSPFNDTDEFMRGEYFLTEQQNNFKRKVRSHVAGSFSISGAAGTGKTLLAYDIAKDAMENNQKVCVVHCGKLNQGHFILKNNGWEIWPLKDFMTNYEGMENFDLIIIDEAQRISVSKIDTILSVLDKFNSIKVYSGDSQQWLHKAERGDKVFEKITTFVSQKNQVKLSKKIRTNRELASFVKEFFNQNDKTQHNLIDSDCVYCEYFDEVVAAKNFAKTLEQEGWTLINQTTSYYDPEFYSAFSSITSLNSHRVIGQEFDKVVVFVGPGYSYKDGKLIGSGTYYHSLKLLFENMTRARKSIFLIFINNTEVFDACIRLLTD